MACKLRTCVLARGSFVVVCSLRAVNDQRPQASFVHPYGGPGCAHGVCRDLARRRGEDNPGNVGGKIENLRTICREKIPLPSLVWRVDQSHLGGQEEVEDDGLTSELTFDSLLGDSSGPWDACRHFLCNMGR
jgi:hypothetical protein